MSHRVRNEGGKIVPDFLHRLGMFGRGIWQLIAQGPRFHRGPHWAIPQAS